MILNHQAKVLAVMLCMGVAVAQEDRTLLPQDYKCGISIRYSGTEGVDWIAEEHYHEPLQNNRRTVYIKDTTEISMFHNKLNQVTVGPTGYCGVVGEGGPDGIIGNADDGKIRYRFDGDYNMAMFWADNPTVRAYPTFPLLPEYTTPFTLASRTYVPLHPDVPVVGTTGYNGAPLTDTMKRMHYGYLDSAGDEWHSMCIGDDDAAYQILNKQRSAYWASDGKEQLFVVNPKTPCITVAHTGSAQFYTTPAKTYDVPRIHDQITYIAPRMGTVSVKLTDINGNVVHYRIGGGSYQNNGTNTVTLTDADFADGENTLECYYVGNEAFVRTRKIVKNPLFPSAGEKHGHLMWGSQEQLERILERRNTGSYAWFWNRCLTRRTTNHHEYWDAAGMRGIRRPWSILHAKQQTEAFMNAFIALAQGWESKLSSSPKTYAQYAKEMLLDNNFNLDLVGDELMAWAHPIPTKEVNGAGYYFVENALNYAPAYDILIAHYRSDQHTNGITPIEDHYIRDMMAKETVRNLTKYRDGKGPEMWTTAQSAGAFMIALAMPDYDTHYYGTSGYNGTTKASHMWTPYPEQAYTWKEIFTDIVPGTGEFPNHKNEFGPDRADDGYFLLGNSGEQYGFWHGGNMGYWELMQPPYATITNLSQLHTTKKWPVIHQAYLHSALGEMRGYLGGTAPAYHPLVLSINSFHPTVADKARQALVDRGVDPAINSMLKLMWFDDKSYPPFTPSMRGDPESVPDPE